MLRMTSRKWEVELGVGAGRDWSCREINKKKNQERRRIGWVWGRVGLPSGT